MRVLLCGADGYLGFCLTQRLLKRGHQVFGIDCFHRRKMVDEVGSISAIPIASSIKRIHELHKLYPKTFGFEFFDISKDYDSLRHAFNKFNPEGVINLAQQPSPAYSMIDAEHANFTQTNNNQGLLNLFWCAKEFNKECHIVTLATMGEYGFPNMPIPEGFFEVTYQGYTDILPFPRQANSCYHVSKIQSSDNSWFACQVWELMSSDIHQGVVYGTRIPEMKDNPILRTRFDFDECFGTAINRFVSMAVVEEPILLYGSGNQIRPYIALTDSIECLSLVIENPPDDTDSFRGYRVINQFDDYYSLLQLAKTIQKVAEQFDLETEVKHIPNPRIEAEVHFYQPEHKKLYDLGWKPTKSLEETLSEMFTDLLPFKERFISHKHLFIPRIYWRKKHES